MAQVSVENNACPLRYSAVFHYIKLTIFIHTRTIFIVPWCFHRFSTSVNTCENITSAATAVITTQMISSRPDRVSGTRAGVQD